VIRVAYITGEPNPSRVPHLRVLAAAPDVELTVVYAAATVHRRTWTLDVDGAVVLRGPRLPTTFLLHHDYPLTPQVWRLLDRGRYDVVIVGGWSLMATQLAIVWARTHRVPYLLISENHNREPRPQWVRAVKSLVLRHVVPPAAGHLVTGTLAREHQLAYGARAERIAIWPNTVDVEAYARRIDALRPARAELRASFGVDPGATVVLHVGRLIPEKGPDDLLDAVARATSFGEVRLHLLMVGDGPMDDQLRARAAELSVSATFTGLLEGDRLLEAYAAADVFALLSRRETWGIVVNEAAAAGLPLVLTDRVGASADLLHDDVNGLTVRSGDRDGQAAALARLARDPELRETFGRRSRELVAPMTYEASVSDLVALLREVVPRP
jgi:glycosyltransferase involved in cell wall biosynthesis